MATATKTFPLGSNTGGGGGTDVQIIWSGSSAIIYPQTEYEWLAWDKVKNYRYIVITLYQAIEGYDAFSKQGVSVLVDIQQLINSSGDERGSDYLNTSVSYFSSGSYGSVEHLVLQCTLEYGYIHIRCSESSIGTEARENGGVMSGVSISEIAGFGKSSLAGGSANES